MQPKSFFAICIGLWATAASAVPIFSSNASGSSLVILATNPELVPYTCTLNYEWTFDGDTLAGTNYRKVSATVNVGAGANAAIVSQTSGAYTNIRLVGNIVTGCSAAQQPPNQGGVPGADCSLPQAVEDRALCTNFCSRGGLPHRYCAYKARSSGCFRITAVGLSHGELAGPTQRIELYLMPPSGTKPLACANSQAWQDGPSGENTCSVVRSLNGGDPAYFDVVLRNHHAKRIDQFLRVNAVNNSECE
jgi:hypothetical protein